MRKWQYLVEELPLDADAIREALDSLGDIGWELVETWDQGGNQTRMAVFKRPAPGLPQC